MVIRALKKLIITWLRLDQLFNLNFVGFRVFLHSLKRVQLFLSIFLIRNIRALTSRHFNEVKWSFFLTLVVESYGRLEKVFLFPPSTKSICCPVSLFMVCTIQWSLYSETRIVKYWQQWFFREWSFHTNIVVLDFTYVLTTFSIIPTARPNNEGMVYWNVFSLSRIDLIFIEHSWENGFLAFSGVTNT